MKLHWQCHFMTMAWQTAAMSKDPATKVGCVLVNPDNVVVATGFNGFARGVTDSPERLNNWDEKIIFTVHAEANAVAAAARVGAPLKGCTAIVTKHPCHQCAGILIQAGITDIICPPIAFRSRWFESNRNAHLQCREAGVKITYYSSEAT